MWTEKKLRRNKQKEKNLCSEFKSNWSAHTPSLLFVFKECSSLVFTIVMTSLLTLSRVLMKGLKNFCTSFSLTIHFGVWIRWVIKSFQAWICIDCFCFRSFEVTITPTEDSLLSIICVAGSFWPCRSQHKGYFLRALPWPPSLVLLSLSTASSSLIFSIAAFYLPIFLFISLFIHSFTYLFTR